MIAFCWAWNAFCGAVVASEPSLTLDGGRMFAGARVYDPGEETTVALSVDDSAGATLYVGLEITVDGADPSLLCLSGPGRFHPTDVIAPFEEDADGETVLLRLPVPDGLADMRFRWIAALLHPDGRLEMTDAAWRVRWSVAVTLEGARFLRDGEPWFVTGGNWRVIDYGRAFGPDPWEPEHGGVSHRLDDVRSDLARFAAGGVGLVRVGLFDDGRAMFDESGIVVPWAESAFFRQDVLDFLDAATEARVMVEFTLFDYLLAGRGAVHDGVALRGREELVTDASTRRRFIDDMLLPMLDAIADHPALFGFDIINEPEWLLSREEDPACGDWESASASHPVDVPETPLACSDFAAFVDDCAAAVRAAPGGDGLFLTVGVSAKFHAMRERLGLDTDYLAVHYYPSWMTPLERQVVDFDGTIPWMLEEFPSQLASLSVALTDPASETSVLLEASTRKRGDAVDYVDLAFGLGGAGALVWNLAPAGDDKTAPESVLSGFLDDLGDRADAYASGEAVGLVETPPMRPVSESFEWTLSAGSDMASVTPLDAAGERAAVVFSGSGSATVTVVGSTTGASVATTVASPR